MRKHEMHKHGSQSRSARRRQSAHHDTSASKSAVPTPEPDVVRPRTRRKRPG